MAKATKKQANKASLLDGVAKLSIVSKIVIVVASIVVLGGGFYGLFYGPYLDQVNSLERNIDNAKKDLTTQQDLLKKHQAIETQALALKGAYLYMERFLPKENEMPRLVQMVSEIGARAGLSDGVTLFAPKLPAVVRDNYAEIPFTMNLQGEFLTVLSFLYDFSRMDRIVNITQVDIGSPKMVDERREIFHIAVKCTGSTYRSLTPEEIAMQAEAAKSPQKGRGRR